MFRIALITFLAIPLLVSCALAQDAEAEDWMEYDAVYGKVVAVDPAGMTITVLDEDDTTEATYRIKEGAEVENADSVADIKVGAIVDVEFYADRDGTNVADFIYVDTEEEEEEEEEEEIAEPEFEVEEEEEIVELEFGVEVDQNTGEGEEN